MHTPDTTKAALLTEDAGIQLLKTALQNDAELFVVGGAVRDALMGRTTKDIDLACSLNPEQIMSRLAKHNVHCIPTGLQHQTVTAVPFEGGDNYEITSFRSKGMNPDGGVFLGKDIFEDLSFRDFTINSLAVDTKTSELIDPHQGLKDIQERRLRCSGQAAERFLEDPLRIMRLCRFESQFGFTVEKQCLQSALSLVENVELVSIERIRDEFNKTLLGTYPSLGLNRMQNLGLFDVFLPEFSTCYGFEQNRYHSKDVFHHTLEVIEKTETKLVLRLAAFFHDIGKPPSLSVGEDGERHFYKHEKIGAEMTVEIMKRLKYPKKIREQVSVLVDTHMRPITSGAAGMRRLLRDTEGVFEQWRELKQADASSVEIDLKLLKKQLAEFDTAIEEIRQKPNLFTVKDLEVSGEDMIALGMTPGPIFGDILDELLEKVLDNPELNQKETLIEMIKAHE